MDLTAAIGDRGGEQGRRALRRDGNFVEIYGTGAVTVAESSISVEESRAMPRRQTA